MTVFAWWLVNLLIFFCDLTKYPIFLIMCVHTCDAHTVLHTPPAVTCSNVGMYMVEEQSYP